ncbi:HPr kinase [Kushneria pakistanensis]|uniref:3-oxo-tetronate kinase n=1 Tax=Kushneria pakistanensis TaxID=1508770 RepID=A0ABQ3FB83_9GAMM|nr:3-oxo-tetronate kinase [Kushneria pakistanensis]GHC16949.1 HPr kinase [Kushneria pakistanensis]
MPLLGCIADDFTGATDLASQLVSIGMRTVQTIGIPDEGLADELQNVDAVVVALKSRTIPAEEAISQSLAALEWLQARGCKQFYFKYCSTFDSTSEGNIGPVTDALMDALDVPFTVACPALPANRRTVYNGYLFAGGVPLNESGMQDHPLTPMTDANLVRVMGSQSRHRIGLVDFDCVRQGSEAVRSRFDALQADGVGVAILDAIEQRDLETLGEACRDLKLVTAGSGLALGLGARWSDQLTGERAAELPTTPGREAILSGSCSRATLAQIEHARSHYPHYRLDALALADDYQRQLDEALTMARDHLDQSPVLIYASASPENVKKAQQALGVQAAGEIVERALGDIAATLVNELDVRRLLVAGGESSGAVVSALNVKGLQIGPSIDPGVPWTVTLGTGHSLALALKSGNFGSEDFMTKAWERMP